MNTKQLLAGLLIAGSALTANAQNVASTATLTSGGQSAGTAGNEGAYYGYLAGQFTSGSYNCFYGSKAGSNNTTGTGNVFMGYRAGIISSTGSNNTIIGNSAGLGNTTGGANVFVGANAATSNKDGARNVFMGYAAANKHVSGNDNVYLGYFSGGNGIEGPKQNTFVGAYSGYENTGSANVFLGNYAGYGTNVSAQLYITNTQDDTPLIWGNFKADLIKLNGKTGVGGIIDYPTMAGDVDVSKYMLYVKGGILTEELRVSLQDTWADYVFEEDYKLLSLEEVEAFIKENGHLPNVPSAAEIKKNGLEFGEIATIQQEKIEELTLYIIEQKKQTDKLIEKQDREIKELKALVQQMIDKK